MTFCRATRTYFKANEGIEATNQFGEKHLYSPYAEFFYCMECSKRMITEKGEEYNTRRNFYKQIKEANLIRKRVEKALDVFEKFGDISHEDRRRAYIIANAVDRISKQDLHIFNSTHLIINIASKTKEEFNLYIKQLRQSAKNVYMCGQESRIDSYNNGLCTDCKDEFNYRVCDNCGEWVKDEDELNIETVDGSLLSVCEGCFDNVYIKCSCCGRYIDRETDSYEEVNGEIYCQDCLEENFTRCEECNEWFHPDDICTTYDGHSFCSYCYDDNTRECLECGNTYRITDMEYDEDGYVCYNCQTIGNRIHNYSYKPHPKKHGKDIEKIGMEIEVEGASYKANKFLEEFGDTEENDIYLKRDGSVAGFEIVTHPMTRKYFYREFVPKLSKGMAFLRKEGFKGHNRAGIHIHVSTEAINEDMLKKMMILIYSKQKTTYQTWLKITQRKDCNMSQWSSMNPDSLKGTKKDVAKLLDRNKVAGYRTKPPIAHGRYTAINCNNENTIEFRIFNSNIRTERIIKNAQVVFSLIDFTKTDKLPTMNNYLKFIAKNKEAYKELYEFLIEKEIINPELTKFMETMNVKSIEGLKKELTAIQKKRNAVENLSNINTENDERNEQCA